MSENDVETGQESGKETTGTEQQPTAEKVVKKAKAAIAATSQPQAPAQKTEKTKARQV